MRPLAIIPAYTRDTKGGDLLAACLDSLRGTADCDVLVVDDGSPWKGGTRYVCDMHEIECIVKENGGFSSAVNVGLQRCLDGGRDAVLVNSDIEFTEEGWLEALEGTDADVVGALLAYPFGRVQSAGTYFSPLNRGWFHRFHWSPLDVEEVHREAECPCTAALQLIRCDTIRQVGLYDEQFPLAFEDVDHALRVFDAGGRCAYQPAAKAVHHESATRGDGTMSEKELESWQLLYAKYNDRDLSRFEWRV